MCSLLVVDDPGARMTLSCTVSDEQVSLEAVREPSDPPIDVGRLSEQILQAVVDHFEVDVADARIVLTKRRQS